MTAQFLINEDYNGLRKAEDGLPSHYYFDAAHHERELKAIWYRNWIYLCRAKSLEEPGCYRVFDIGTQQILLLRDAYGKIRAFHNTCRHRGSQLCRESEGRFLAQRITCPYHRWTYSLQGDLLRTSSLGFPQGFDPNDYPLYKVAIAEWRGFVFVNLAGNSASSLELSFDRDSTALDHWPLESLVVGHRYRKIMKCNWKIFLENYNECLHCPGVHPELCSLVPIFRRSIMVERDDPRWREHAEQGDVKFKQGLRPGAETWSMDGLAQGTTFPNLTEEERRVGYSYVTIVPSFYVAAYANYVRSVWLRPLDVERTELQADFLFSPETLADPAFNLANVVDFATRVMEQDAAVCELNQRGVHSLPHEKSVLMPEEYLLKGFQDWIRTELQNLP